MKEENKFYVYVTKYALTQGILFLEVEDCETDWVVRIVERNYSSYLRGEGREWHRTIESAEKVAKEMQKKKIVSLERQLEKIRSMEF